MYANIFYQVITGQVGIAYGTGVIRIIFVAHVFIFIRVAWELPICSSP